VAYLPTFRDTKQASFSFHNLGSENRKKLNQILEKHGAVLLEKNHFVDGFLRDNEESHNIRDLIFTLEEKGDVDTQEILLVSDLLITDYSGCYLDFLLLDRPVIHFAYDYDYYDKKDRGLYYALDKVAAGDIVHNLENLLRVLDLSLQDRRRGDNQRARIRELMISKENGDSCEVICNSILESKV